MQMVTALVRHSGDLLSQQAVRSWRWRGRVVKLGDGTTICNAGGPVCQRSVESHLPAAAAA
jgi:hypothetical protein